MPSTNQRIDQLIEESYLLSLSEEEIRSDLDRFVEVCGKVIRENVHDRKQMQELAQKLARARALSLIEDHHEDDDELSIAEPFEIEDESRSPKEIFAEKVARNKCLILKTIRDCSPGLEDLIDKERYPALADESESPLPLSTGTRQSPKDTVFKVFYVVTLLFVLLLVYLVLLQQNF
tara:strand:- start:162 stop:692 length:531 start_codon:yes stop_codon:yes gene_type:complete